MPAIYYPPPAFTLAGAARISQSHFNIDGVVTPLPGERELNFWLDADGDSYGLKIAAADEERGLLEMWHAALAHLARREPGLDIGLQRAIFARGRRDYNSSAGAVVAMKDGVMSSATRTLTYLHGDHLGSTSLTTNAAGQKVSEQPFAGAQGRLLQARSLP